MKKNIAENRKARFNYEIISKLEAGLVLTGSEIKAIRTNNISLQDSYVTFQKQEAFLINMNIGSYKFTTAYQINPSRKRKLLLHQKEIKKLLQEQKLKNLVIIPLRLYLNHKNLAKVEIAIARPRKLYDKREAMKIRDMSRKIKNNRFSFMKTC